ncbi:hypothetical protein JGI1_02023 [Candidatus Thermokryptus mobilis]|uniref:Uncharacterized protein n=1 Tax=Candidatus Thermokryptus mobilis TaxID=1643428 RepID=A0A0S4NDU6_9BACT|nr:hypothetical protein [Candidatus Thermokryptus mobilis]CUU08221.1 hypothetical protein JGI1_02023 [Candidatus Thermokryptus mobilis]
MKRLIIFVLLLSILNPVLSQRRVQRDTQPIRPQTSGEIAGGLGLSWFDGKPYYLLNISPELAFGKFGIGFDVNLRIGVNDGKIRSEDWNEFYDFLRAIRYVRYGLKGDPFYARIGALDYARLGHGTIIYYYKNNASYDDRKVGLEFDVDFGKFGFESVTSDLRRVGVFGVRGYVRPLKLTPAGEIPVIGNLELGATYATDFDKDALARYDSIQRKIVRDGKKPDIIGFDIGLPIIRTKIFGWDLYFDYVKFLNYGSGIAYGTIFDFKGLGILNINAKIERRNFGDQFLPSYFNYFYEIERFNLRDTVNATSKLIALQNAKKTAGTYGELIFTILGQLQVVGSYQQLDATPESGTLHFDLKIPQVLPTIVIDAGYDKVNIKDLRDAFKLDERSLLYAQVGYKPVKYIIVSMFYQWTFKPVRTDNGTKYEVQKRVEPRVSFVFPFGTK